MREGLLITREVRGLECSQLELGLVRPEVKEANYSQRAALIYV